MTRDEIFNLAKKNAIVGAAISLYRAGTVNWEEAMTIAVKALADSLDETQIMLIDAMNRTVPPPEVLRKILAQDEATKEEKDGRSV